MRHSVELVILVLSAADSGTAMAKAGLQEAQVPFVEVDLTQPDRPTIDAAFLTEVTATALHAKFQAVILPDAAPAQLSADERAALDQFERTFHIRELDSYVYPSPEVGLNYPLDPGYSGALDGFTAQVTAAGRAGPFSYLTGPIDFDDLDAHVPESYGYLALARPDEPSNARSFVPFVSMPLPNDTSRSGVLLGVYSDHGREQLVVAVALNASQFQQQALFPGMLAWLTYGVHLGSERHYFSVHIDDVFLSDARWSTTGNCTSGDDCPAGVSAPEIAMTAADVDYLVAWQQQNGMRLELAFNGAGYDEASLEGAYPFGARVLELRRSFRFINHTYSHPYLGCVQDFSVVPFRCATGADGQPLWTPYQLIYDEITRNQTFASQHGLPLSRSEVVTGEHSALRRAPQEPSDNPNLAQALRAAGITWLGSDSSREFEQRAVGNAQTVPRYPMNIFYNVARKSEEVDEYNWLYNARADAGSGICEQDPASTCIAPLDPETGFDAYIAPLEARHALLHALSNSPRPHYAHQSNLAEDRILYAVLDRVLARYRRTFAASAPLVNASMSEFGAELLARSTWQRNAARVTARVNGRQLTIDVSGRGLVNLPLTVPAGSFGAGSLSTYAGQLTGWQSAFTPRRVILLPSSVAYAP